LEFESMDLDQLASYLNRDSRELDKLAKRGHLPAQKIAGAWRFARAEINLWIEAQLPTLSEDELVTLERGARRTHDQPLLASLLGESTIGWPLAANTRASLLKELVTLAEQSWQVYDPEALLQDVREREEAGPTALAGGVALPHPRRRMPATVLGESVVALGYVPRGLAFGAPDGGPTNLFFLVACGDQATHLNVLTRLSRLFLRPGFLSALRGAETAADAFRVIESSERELLST
jgi:mannitol/fructose-specific phosphotransferase system IIA component (Ntr-type)